MDDLAKRTAGTPLSPAELEQRRAAARARWAAIGGAAGGAATAAAIASHEIGQRRAAAAAEIRGHRPIIADTARFNARRWQRHGLKVHLQLANLAPHGGQAFVDHAARTTASQLRRAGTERRQVFAANAIERVMGDGTPVQVVLPEAGLDGIIAREERLDERLKDLRANGRGARRVRVEGVEAHPVRAHQRNARGARVPVWEQGADGMFDHLRSQLGVPPAPRPATPPAEGMSPPRKGKKALRYRLEDHHATVQAILSPLPEAEMEDFSFRPAPADQVRAFLKQHPTLDHVAASLDGMSPQEKNAFLQSHGLPSVVMREGPGRVVNVPALAVRQGRDHHRRVAGYPDNATRRRLSEELSYDVYRREQEWRGAETERAAARIGAARRFARQQAGGAYKTLALLRHARTRLGIVAGAAGLAAAAGGLGSWLATRPKVEKLAKAFDAARHTRDSKGRFAGAVGPWPAKADPPRVTMLIGKPGSGKSTWRATGLAQHAVRPTVVVSSDDHVEDVARQRGVGFSQAFKLVDFDQVEKAQRAQIRAAVAAGHDIIIDRINASAKGRAKTLRGIPASYQRHAVVFSVPQDELQRRRALRPGKVIPRRALQEMNAAWSLPQPGEFDAVHHAETGAPPDSTLRKSTPETPQDALARRLAALFGTWTDGAEDKILAPSATTMHGDMLNGLDEALRPLDQVVKDGMTAAIPVETGEGGRNLAFTLQARSPTVQAYVDQYRQSRIVALADEQKATIKAQLLDAATAGADPQAMARRIKQTIGLTPFQAGHVVNYLHELETLNPAALQRQLRDKRFDSTIQRAMEDGTVLSADYIQKVVDAYHRRYLAFRATTIANTEAVGAANNGQAAAAAALEGQHPDFEIEKEWIATDDERTRHDHAELNGQVVRGLDTPFQCASGDLIRWPHDPMAPARQVIRCRCSWVTRLVPRLRPESAASLRQNT